MVDVKRRTSGSDAGQALVEELLRTAFCLGGAYVSLLEDLPADAFPGEDTGAVLIEMFAGSASPALEAAGEESCRTAAALIGAVKDCVLGDLGALAQSTRSEE